VARKWSDVLLFELAVCGVSWLFSVAGSIAPQIVLTIPANGLSIGSNTLLLLAASLGPGLVLVLRFRECRASMLRFAAGLPIYLLAFSIGILMPFASYIGAGHSYPFWDSNTASSLVRIFLVNLFLSPFWEEVIWRGYFYPKVSSLFGLRNAILIASLGWTIWHFGFLFYLYKSGVPAAILPVFVVQVFLVGVIQCSIFTLSRNSLAPCVLLHTALNASTAIYYGSYDRVADLGSYIAESIAALLVAGVLLKLVARRTTLSSESQLASQ
jgi:membrane protease YdiL (CAAX protease family)